jgi:hypothetical protein
MASQALHFYPQFLLVSSQLGHLLLQALTWRCNSDTRASSSSRLREVTSFELVMAGNVTHPGGRRNPGRYSSTKIDSSEITLLFMFGGLKRFLTSNRYSRLLYGEQMETALRDREPNPQHEPLHPREHSGIQ